MHPSRTRPDLTWMRTISPSGATAARSNGRPLPNGTRTPRPASTNAWRMAPSAALPREIVSIARQDMTGAGRTDVPLALPGRHCSSLCRGARSSVDRALPSGGRSRRFESCRARSMNAEELLAEARSGLERLGPAEARKALEAGALLVDIRSESQRARDGVVPGARFVQRNVLEWRLDPEGDWRDPELARPDAHVALMCQDGYQSSLAAANLQKLGIERATDVEG